MAKVIFSLIDLILIDQYFIFVNNNCDHNYTFYSNTKRFLFFMKK